MKWMIVLLLPFLLFAGDPIEEEEIFEWIGYEDFDEVIAENEVCIIEFWAEWNQSNAMDDLLFELSDEFDAYVYRANLDLYPAFVNEFSLKGVPTIIVFIDGEIYERFDPNYRLQIEDSKDIIKQKIKSYYNE